LFQAHALLASNTSSQQAPQPVLDPGANAKNKPFQRATARQQNLMRQQPGGGAIEEYARPLGSGPAEHVKPARQPKSDTGFGDVAVSEIQSDLGSMLPPLFARPIGGKIVQLRKAQLVCERSHDFGGSRYWIVEKRPEIAHGTQLQRKTEAVVLATATPDLYKLVVTQMEEAV